jgi:hypothetical protein
VVILPCDTIPVNYSEPDLKTLLLYAFKIVAAPTNMKVTP